MVRKFTDEFQNFMDKLRKITILLIVLTVLSAIVLIVNTLVTKPDDVSYYSAITTLGIGAIAIFMVIPLNTPLL